MHTDDYRLILGIKTIRYDGVIQLDMRVIDSKESIRISACMSFVTQTLVV